MIICVYKLVKSNDIKIEISHQGGYVLVSMCKQNKTKRDI